MALESSYSPTTTAARYEDNKSILKLNCAPDWFKSCQCPKNIKSYLKKVPAADSSESKIVQPWWTTLIKKFNSTLDARCTLQILDRHKYPTIGTRKPDCPMYAKERPHSVLNMVAIGELKTRRSTHSADFSYEEKGHLLEFIENLILEQPWRKDGSVTGFLSDAKYIQFFFVSYSAGLYTQIKESNVLELATDGADWLYGLLCTDYVTLGWNLPTFTYNDKPLKIVKMLGQGATSIVFEVEQNKETFVAKQFRPGTNHILANEANMLKIASQYNKIPKLLAQQDSVLILQPVAMPFAADVDSYIMALRGKKPLAMLTLPLMLQLVDLLEQLHKNCGIVHRDIKLSNLFENKGEVSVR